MGIEILPLGRCICEKDATTQRRREPRIEKRVDVAEHRVDRSAKHITIESTDGKLAIFTHKYTEHNINFSLYDLSFCFLDSKR